MPWLVALGSSAGWRLCVVSARPARCESWLPIDSASYLIHPWSFMFIVNEYKCFTQSAGTSHSHEAGVSVKTIMGRRCETRAMLFSSRGKVKLSDWGVTSELCFEKKQNSQNKTAQAEVSHEHEQGPPNGVNGNLPRLCFISCIISFLLLCLCLPRNSITSHSYHRHRRL